MAFSDRCALPTSARQESAAYKSELVSARALVSGYQVCPRPPSRIPCAHHYMALTRSLAVSAVAPLHGTHTLAGLLLSLRRITSECARSMRPRSRCSASRYAISPPSPPSVAFHGLP